IGDIVVFEDAGAHCSAMHGVYNSTARPSEYLLSPDGSIHQIARREQFIDHTRRYRESAGRIRSVGLDKSVI
ncbi:hypothetical protein KY359_04375, partial [Candidatus Woesearchaeota archaeon]|nr:hypothetical protein [Candidatus Woesearchaeota archaeon]